MRRVILSLVCLMLGVGPSSPLQAQPANGYGAEPENHTVVVERLVRYHDSGEYDRQIRDIVNGARDYLASRLKSLAKGEKPAVVLDIDETALSNWDSMSACGFCAYSVQMKLYPDARGAAIAPVLELYNFAKSKGAAVFFVTGRGETRRQFTVDNLREAGYSGWTDLIMRPEGDKSPARVLKPQNRQSIEAKGYRILLSMGDQSSDLAGCCAERIFKLPNPYYQIP